MEVMDNERAREELNVDAEISLKIDLTVDSVKDAIGSVYEDRLLPAREMTKNSLAAAERAKDKAKKDLEDLAQKVADATLKQGKIPGTKEFNVLVKAFNAANAVRSDKTRYEVHLESPRADADKKIIRGKLQVRDVVAKSHYSRDDYHEELVEMPVKIPFTAELKDAVKHLDAAVKEVAEAKESDQMVTRLMAQKQKVIERTGRGITMKLVAGESPTRKMLLDAGNEAIEQTMNGTIQALPAPIRKVLMLEAPKAEKKSKSKSKKK